MSPPDQLRWLFGNVDFAALSVEDHANDMMARVLEFGLMNDVQWLLRTYGPERVHRFFREVGHPELSRRTLGFWRAYFNAEDEVWAAPPAWRLNNETFWPG